MKRRTVLILAILYAAAGFLSCLQLKRMDFLPAAAGTAAGISLTAPGSVAYANTGAQKDERETTPESEAPKAQTFTASHRQGRLFIRQGPSTRTPILGFLSPGDTGEVLDTANGWALVKAGSLTGYVSLKYLTLQDTSA